MKKILILFTFLLCFEFSAQSQINAGVGLSYSNGEGAAALGVQAKALVGFADDWRLVGAYTYFFQDNASYSIDADIHYELITLGESTNIFPFAGLNFGDYGGEFDIGINLGLFSDFRVSDNKMHIYLEPKYLFTGSNTFVMSAGVMF